MFGRQKTVEKLEETTDLDPIEDPSSITDLTQAVEEISIERVKNPPQKPIEAMQHAHSNLNDEKAKSAYIADDVLLRRINAARRQFNKWKGRKLRSKEIPTSMEAGPAKYDHEKTKKKARYAREANEELAEKLDRVRAAANGARNRALNAIGSSIAEENAKEAQSKRESVRERLETGMIVQFRNPRETIGRVVRVNKKTVTVEFERGYTEDPLTGEKLDPLAESRVDLDSEWLTLLPKVDSIEEGKQKQDISS